MTELLFKLKKDGKMVGYLGLVGTRTQQTAAERPIPATDGLRWYSIDLSEVAIGDTELEWDTIHSFVCRDKNGKDVFEGDENIRHWLYPHDLATMIYEKQFLTYKLFYPLTKHYRQLCLTNNQLTKCEDFELIEDANALRQT